LNVEAQEVAQIVRPSFGNPIPIEALSSHIAILGKTGSGKSNAAKIIVERGLEAGERICIIDPTGSWYGLRLKANGEPSDYPVVIFGGLHADKQISGRHGAAIAELVATSSTPAVIDTRLMTVGERTTFFKDFAETLLRRNRGPLRLVVDEAHLFAPQGKVPDAESGKMLHAANNLVSLGRSIGLRVVLISQRPAKLHKDSLTQAETLVAMRVIHPLDRGAVEEWIKDQADKEQGKEIVASLPSLPTGDAWIWSPEIGLLKRAHFPLAGTYDSGKAPNGDETAPELRPIDLEKIDALLDKAAADIKANDPKALRIEVARLTRELAETRKDAVAPAWPDQRELVQSLSDELTKTNAALEKLTGDSALLLRRQEAALAALQGERIELPAVTPVQRHVVPALPPVQRKPTPVREPPEGDGSVPHGCAKPLAALAGVYPAGMTEAQWATAAGYKRTGGTWQAYRSRLRGAGLTESRGGLWFATEGGAHAVGDVELPPPPGPDLARWWAAKIHGTPKLVEALIEAWPDPLPKDELAERIGMTASGGSFQAYVSRLRSPGLIEQDGAGIRLSDEVMGA
jgi:hypothetical protein